MKIETFPIPFKQWVTRCLNESQLFDDFLITLRKKTITKTTLKQQLMKLQGS